VDLHDYLRYTADKGGSDLHLKAGGPAYVRIDGTLSPCNDLPALTAADTERFARQAMSDELWERFSSASAWRCSASAERWGWCCGASCPAPSGSTS